MDRIKKIAQFISEDPDLSEAMEVLGSEKEMPVIIPWATAPEWFNEWLKMIPTRMAKEVLMGYLTGDKEKQRAYLDKVRVSLGTHASL